jgi:opacity protein-like surface antigen
MKMLPIMATTLLFASTASAQGFNLAADAGYTRILNGDGVNGFGADVFAGYAFEFGLVPELQLGFHYNSTSSGEGDAKVTATTTSLPIMAGVRYNLDLGAPVVPWAGAHFGATFYKPGGKMGDVSIEGDMESDLSFNAGAGVNYMINDKMGIGAALWYWMVFSGSEETAGSATVETEHAKYLTAGLNFNFAF